MEVERSQQLQLDPTCLTLKAQTVVVVPIEPDSAVPGQKKDCWKTFSYGVDQCPALYLDVTFVFPSASNNFGSKCAIFEHSNQ